MIEKIKIENYKSVASLELELGRVNVFIGENGSGKTNVLEGVALGSAAIDNKLDNEFLANRGIRYTQPVLMKTGFNYVLKEANIKLNFKIYRHVTPLNIKLIIETYDNLKSSSKIEESENLLEKLKLLQKREKKVGISLKEIAKELESNSSNIDRSSLDEFIKTSKEASKLKDDLEKLSLEISKYVPLLNAIIHDNLGGFLIYAPENYFLRRFDEEAQIRPLGIRGEGLFSHLVYLSQEKPDLFSKIKGQLQLIDWFEDFEIPSDLAFTERRLTIKDRYLEEGLQYIDQRSSNEGFLYLLFYITLFISDATPKFFAIDNIDNSLNPALCTKLMEVLAKLAKEHDKQVILTTHNPGVLDGLNLNDDEQRLFVISRNAIGHTKALRIKEKASTNGQTPVKLSEQFLRGYIGGLPVNI